MSCTGGKISSLELPVNPDCDCVGIKRIQWGENDTLIITLTNGQTYTSGSLQGDDGVGITSATVNDDFELVVVLSNGQTYTSASLQGPAGPTGPQGIPGEQVLASRMTNSGTADYASWTMIDFVALPEFTFAIDQDMVSFVMRGIITTGKSDVGNQSFRIVLDGQTLISLGPLDAEGPIGIRFEGNITRTYIDAVYVEIKACVLSTGLLPASYTYSQGDLYLSPTGFSGLDFSQPLLLEFQAQGDDIRNDIFIVKKHKFVTP